MFVYCLRLFCLILRLCCFFDACGLRRLIVLVGSVCVFWFVSLVYGLMFVVSLFVLGWRLVWCGSLLCCLFCFVSYSCGGCG